MRESDICNVLINKKKNCISVNLSKIIKKYLIIQFKHFCTGFFNKMVFDYEKGLEQLCKACGVCTSEIPDEKIIDLVHKKNCRYI